MKAFCLQEAIMAALEMTSRVTPARSAMTIAQNVLIRAEQGMLRMTATNLEMVIRINIPATIEREGSLAVPNRLIRDFVAALPKGPILMEQPIGRTALKVSCGCSQAVINAEDAALFPEMPEIEFTTRVMMNADEFRKAVSRVAFCTATEAGGRPVLTGILMELKEREMITVGADGFRMAAQRTGLEHEPSGRGDAKVVVPARVMMEVQRLSDRRGGVVEVMIPDEQNNVRFRIGGEEPEETDIEVTSLLLVGSFPNHATLVPREMPNQADFDLRELTHATRQAALFAKDRNNTVVFDIGRDESGEMGRTTISSESQILGNNEAAMRLVGIKGDDIKIAFNNRYLQEVLAHLDSKDVRLETSSQSSAAKIEIPDETEYVYVMMPILTLENQPENQPENQ